MEKSFEKFRKIEGLEVLDEDQAQEKYHRNTIGIKRILLGALRPTRVEQIQEIVALANKHSFKLYTFSTGHNWGYGSSIPTVDHCIIVDLSGMKRILEFNDDLGYVTLEPGVTQQDLYDFMVKTGREFMVPTTGAGPSCSLIGNALDKGYGVTPNEDHFASILSLQAVLASGEIYTSSLSAIGAQKADKIYKWKMGPYLDGLFTQSNFGIVTQATIALARRPEVIGQFIAYVSKEDLKRAVTTISQTKERLGNMIGGINIMNTHRMLAMVEVKSEWQIDGVISDERFQKLKKKRKLPDWGVLVGLYCPKELIPAVKKHLEQEFSYASKTYFFTPKSLKRMEYWLSFLPANGFSRTLKTIDNAIKVLGGVPSEVALPLAYIKNPNPMPASGLNPDRDGCGERWFNPIVPMESGLVEEFCGKVMEVMSTFGFEPLITLTAVSQRYFASNIPIIFNVNDDKQLEDSLKCFNQLMKVAESLHIAPDRISIDTMREIYDHTEAPVFTMSQKIKKALDPKGIFSPGRYIKLSEY